MGRVCAHLSLTYRVSHPFLLLYPYLCHLPLLTPTLLYASLQTLTLSGPVRAKLDTLRKMCVHPQFGLEMVSGRGGGGTGDRPMSILQVLEARLDEAKQKQASAEERRARKSGDKSSDKSNKRPRKSTQLEQRITFLENQLASAKTAHVSEQARLKASSAAAESSGTGGAGGGSSAGGERLTGPKSFHDGSSSSSSSNSSTADATDAAAGGGPNDAGEEGGDGQCLICFEPFEDQMLTPCLHTFCKLCLVGCIENQHRCPLCRHPLRLSDMTPVLAGRELALAEEWPTNGVKFEYLSKRIRELTAERSKAREELGAAAVGGEKSGGGKGKKKKGRGKKGNGNSGKKVAAAIPPPFKCVIFSSWTKALELLARFLGEASIGAAIFVGECVRCGVYGVYGCAGRREDSCIQMRACDRALRTCVEDEYLP